ncbi:MAG: cytochrome c [Acidobacteriota bacterium]
MKHLVSPFVCAFALTITITALALCTESPAENNRTLVATERNAASLYSHNCASCHGRDGKSRTFKAKFNHARDLSDSDWQGSVTDERIFKSITNGRGKMPAFHKKMSDAEIDSLVLFVRGLKK